VRCIPLRRDLERNEKAGTYRRCQASRTVHAPSPPRVRSLLCIPVDGCSARLFLSTVPKSIYGIYPTRTCGCVLSTVRSILLGAHRALARPAHVRYAARSAACALRRQPQKAGIKRWGIARSCVTENRLPRARSDLTGRAELLPEERIPCCRPHPAQPAHPAAAAQPTGPCVIYNLECDQLLAPTARAQRHHARAMHAPTAVPIW
jgi:hypothetical protein